MAGAGTKILVIRFSSLGDIILLTALLEGLRDALPTAEIHLLTKKRYAELFTEDSRIDRVIPLEGSGLGELKRLRSLCASERYDLIMDAHNVIRSNLLYNTIHAGLKVQIEKDQLKKLLLIRGKINLYGEIVPQSRRYTAMLRHIGVEAPPAKPSLRLPKQAIERARRILAEAGLQENRVVALAPGARWETKQWPLENFGSVAGALLDRGYGIVTIGGPGEEAASESLARMMDSPPLDLSGKLSVTESSAVLSLCALTITNDSAPLHMSEAVGTPAVALFGPTVREFGYYPQLPDSRAVDVEMTCRPCSRNGARPCPIGTKACLVSISPERVIDLALGVLDRADHSSTGEEQHQCT